MEERINIGLSKDEALVLFELLSRFSEEEQLTIADQSEERVLWNIQSLLESELTEPLDKEIAQILKLARQTVLDKI